MQPKIKNKTWIWNLSFFAGTGVSTAWGDTIYLAKGLDPELNREVINHEEIHLRQQKEIGKWKFLFKYLFCWPLFWNQFRYDMEWEAYVKGSVIGRDEINKLLSGKVYGWLQNRNPTLR